MLSSTHTEDALHNKRKRIQDQADTEQNNHEDSTASLAKDISIMDMNPSNYVHVRDMIERYKIKKLLHFKKQWEGIEARKKEIEFLEKFLLGKASASSSSASSSSSGTFPKKQSSSQEVSTTLSQQQVHDGEGGAKKSDDDYLLSPQKNLQDLLEQQGQDNLIKFNVGGKIFTTTKTTISKRENMLKTMIHSEFGIDRDSSGAIMLDRNPDYFPIILEHLRTGSTTHCGLWEERTEATLPKFKELLEESGFFGTQRLSKAVRIIIGEIEHKIKSKTEPPKSTIVSHKKITDETLDSTMVSTGQEKADQEWIESFMSLTITEKEVADSYFTSLEKKIKEENEMLNSKEREIASFSARTDIVFNVRGVKHTVPLRKIVSHPECILNDFLSALEPPKENQPAQNEIFIDRDPEIFGVILNYLQTGQVNIFNLETHKQKQVYRECKLLNLTGLLDYWNPLRYPIETIGEDNIKMKEEEDYIRHLFATDRENPILNDPYLLLINIFENEKTRTSFRKEDPPAQVPLIFNFENPMEKSELTQKQAIVVPPIPKICANRGQFIAQFNAFTYGIFKDMDWSNIVCAGGSVVAALLDHDKKKESISTEAEDSSMEEQASNWDVDDTCEENPEDNDFELEDDDENVFTDSDDEKSIQTQVFATNPFGLAYVSWGTQQPIETTADKELAHTYTYSVWSKSDVDLFIYGLSEKEAEEKINYLFTLFKTNLNGHVYRKYFMSTGQGYNTQLQDDILVVRTEHSVTFYFQYPIRPIQIILRIYKSITEVLCGFDCDSVTFGFDGSQVFCLPRGRRAINTRSNLVDPSRQSKTYEIRLLKYAKRGFRIAIPGYDETKIKNEILLAGKTAYTPIRRRRYRYYMTQTTPRADVRAMTGLARLLVIKQATKFSRNVDKAVNGKYLEDEEMNVHDYKQLSLPYNSLTTAAMNYLTTKRVVEFFKEKLDKKPHFEFALNDVTSVLHASGDNSTISPDVKWITVEPGRQYIGSFHPSTTNFYKDAYTSQLAKKPVVIPKKKKVRVTWHWQHKANYNEYDKSTSALIEKAYQKFKKNKSDHTVVISNTHFIDFNQNKQIALDDRSRMRHVKRTKVKLPNQ
ncbi:hypothetical protein C9374_002102 [Naegleria lovaniensis]|uniref:BTB domain-containing protein n=1 Tax=Naegleria lovaniensis TaxID=51637 RepID=A0AA88GQM5_NAELO|nr:uncharacterized protein C9374_002102 [Naegleria lovaniensis]KAG2387067.1 hypothetical protein C9374_002102 [Naegleria lovaniensis]